MVIFQMEKRGFPAIRARSGKATKIVTHNMTPLNIDPAYDESTMNEVHIASIY